MLRRPYAWLILPGLVALILVVLASYNVGVRAAGTRGTPAATAALPTPNLGQPIISVSPLSGQAGTLVAVTGAGFRPGANVAIRLREDTAGSTARDYAAAQASPDGGFKVSFLLPATWPDGTPVKAGTLIVTAAAPDQQAEAAIAYAPQALSPGGSPAATAETPAATGSPAPAISTPTETATTETVATPTSTPVPATSTPTPPPATAALPAPANQGAVLAGALNVRSGPGMAYPVQTVLPAGGTFTVLGQDASGGWLYIALPNGGTGWVDRSFTNYTLTAAFIAAPPPPLPAPPATPTPTFTPVFSAGLSVVIQQPGGTTVIQSGQQITIQSQASGGSGIARIELWSDGSFYTSTSSGDSPSPYTVSQTWSSTSIGQHTLFARAFDTSGRSADSGSVIIGVTDTNPPSVSVSISTSTVTDGHGVNVHTNATDSKGVTSIQLWVDGNQFAENTSSSSVGQFNMTADQVWTASGVGNHTLFVRVFDSVGKSTQSSDMTVKVVATGTPTPTPTTAPTNTPTPTSTPTRTPRPTSTPSPTPSRTPRPTRTPSPTPTRTPVPTRTPTQMRAATSTRAATLAPISTPRKVGAATPAPRPQRKERPALRSSGLPTPTPTGQSPESGQSLLDPAATDAPGQWSPAALAAWLATALSGFVGGWLGGR